MKIEMEECGANVRVTVNKGTGPGINIMFDDRDFMSSSFGAARLVLDIGEAVAFAAALKALAEQPHRNGDGFTMEMEGEGWRGDEEP